MPLIKPPNDYGMPEPELRTDKPVFNYEQNRRIQLFLQAKTWKCHECGTINCGWNLECVYCRMRNSKHTPRPAHYKKSTGTT